MERISENILINEEIFKLSFKCNNGKCSKLCCRYYTIDVTEGEIQNISSIIKYASSFKKTLKMKTGKFRAFWEEINSFKFIKRDKNGCIFLYKQNKNYLCAVHSACDFYGLKLYKYKPMNCLLWPLLIDYDKDILVVELAEDCKEYDCISERGDRPILIEFFRTFRFSKKNAKFDELMSFIKKKYKIGYNSLFTTYR